jgi:hypothetical protein
MSIQKWAALTARLEEQSGRKAGRYDVSGCRLHGRKYGTVELGNTENTGLPFVIACFGLRHILSRAEGPKWQTWGGCDAKERRRAEHESVDLGLHRMCSQ